MRHYPWTPGAGLIGMLALGTLLTAGCSPKEHDTVVATVGTTPITLSDYEALYLKTLGSREAGAATSMDDRKKFLDLLVKYRLKLAGAYKDGLDKKPELISEIETYKGNLASPFLMEREVVAPGIKKLYARRNEEIRASHILLTLSSGASPSDSALAYSKAYDIIAQLKAGKDFGALAVEHSQDPSAKQNMGDLYYFTAGQLVTPFEDAAYAMQPGTISSAPVRTQFGLHVIKVTDRKASRGEVHASHIMTRFTGQAPTPDDTAKAYAKIAVLRDSLKAGVDFADLARRHSEDPGSASKGGDLGYFSRRRWVQPFDEMAMSLSPGQVSGIVRTVYGYHIIKCLDVRPRKTFDDAKAELQQTYQQLRFKDDEAAYLAALKKDVRYSKNDSAFARLMSSIDTTKSTRDSAWSAGITPAVGRLPLYSIREHVVSVDSALRLIAAQPEVLGTSLLRKNMIETTDKIGEQLVFSVKADDLAKDVPEFAALLKEYREGILLYQAEQDNVWNKVAIGDSVLKEYFAANRDKFTWPDRVSITEVKATNDSLARAIHTKLKSGLTIEQVVTADSLRMAAPINERVTYAKGSASLGKPAVKTLAAVAAAMKADRALRLALTARPDTSSAKERSMKLAAKRLNGVKSYLAGKMKIDPALITTSVLPLPRPSAADTSAEAVSRSNRVELFLAGKQALVYGKPLTALLPVSADDRTRKADSLTAGDVTAPFPSGGMYSIIRLNGREMARQKAFDEAGGELSSAYQDAESKRLEEQWLARVRKDFPVVENSSALKDAFAPEKKQP